MATATTYTQTRKNYYNTNKTVISAKASAYYESNKEHFKQQQKTRYQLKKLAKTLAQSTNPVIPN